MGSKKTADRASFYTPQVFLLVGLVRMGKKNRDLSRKMDKQRLKHIIEGLDWDKLNDWEEEFVQSCELRMDTMGDITPRQEEVLEKIYRGKAR